MLACMAVAIGMNLGTYHFDRQAGYKEFNPGVYVVCDEWNAGVYFNSEGRSSAHVGYTLHVGPVDLTLGLVSGYKGHTIAPLVMPSIKISNYRIGWIPPFEKQKGGITFSLEF